MWPAIAGADVISSEEGSCRGKTEGAACSVDGKDGSCVTSTCYRNDYSQGTPPKSKSVECLKCDPKATPPAPQEPEPEDSKAEAPPPDESKPKASKPSSGGCSAAGVSTGSAGLGLALLGLVFGIRRRTR